MTVLPKASAWVLPLALGATSLSAQQAPQCQATPEIEPQTRLSQLADFWFGDPSYRFAIMLASNARVGQNGIKFIGDIHDLPVGSPVCIPGADEASRLRLRYDRYLEAVQDMALAEPFEEVDTLDPLPETGPFTVVSWVRADQRANFPNSPQPVTLKGDTWVTLHPEVQTFCKAYKEEVSANPDALVLRLEQRLGLGPSSSKTHFVMFELSANAGRNAIFRPCGDPSPYTMTCNVGFPETCNAACQAHKAFFFQQYYTAFGTAHPVEFPWTSLGYTFDWAPGAQRLDGTIGFERVGESEYVIPDGTTVEFVGAMTTADFCS